MTWEGVLRPALHVDRVHERPGPVLLRRGLEREGRDLKARGSSRGPERQPTSLEAAARPINQISGKQLFGYFTLKSARISHFGMHEQKDLVELYTSHHTSRNVFVDTA